MRAHPAVRTAGFILIFLTGLLGAAGAQAQAANARENVTRGKLATAFLDAPG